MGFSRNQPRAIRVGDKPPLGSRLPVDAEGRVTSLDRSATPTPTPSAAPVEKVLTFQQDHTSFADALAHRGVVFPMGGWAPGAYQARCLTCSDMHIGCDKRALCCLPCAVQGAVALTNGAQFMFEQQGYRRGRQSIIDDVKKLEAGS